MEPEENVTAAIPGRQRNRASTACTRCRKSRIRCSLEPGEKSCSQCRSGGYECMFDQKDGRKSRGSSKAFTDGLCQRIQHLEELLKSGAHPDVQTESESARRQDDHHSVESQPQTDTPTTASDQDWPRTLSQDVLSPQRILLPPIRDIEPSLSRPFSRRRVATPFKFDMASGRLLLFKQPTNESLTARFPDTRKEGENQESTHWPVAMLARDLPLETHKYLMDLFWTHHNSIFHIVDRDAFYSDFEQGRTQNYSIFLHFAMLAVAWRYCDKSRSDVARLTSPSIPFTSTLHTKAKDMVALELDRAGGIPSIQALLILSDLEGMAGRTDTGWMYSGMAFRLAFDAGLHFDTNELQITELEARMRHKVAQACFLTDKYWSIHTGRPSFFRSSDLAPGCILNAQLEDVTSTEGRIYRQLIKLMDIASPICNLQSKRPGKTTEMNSQIAAIDRELTGWLAGLPEDLKWANANRPEVSPALYHLHLQYHAILILLHRPLVNYNEVQDGDEQGKGLESEPFNHFTMLSRTVCSDHSKEIAAIMSLYGRRFGLSRCPASALHHIGTAATVIMAELVIHSNFIERKELLANLMSLGQALSEMARTLEPAVLMTSVVDAFLHDFDRGKQATAPSRTSDNLPERSMLRVGDIAGTLALGKRGFHELQDVLSANKRSRLSNIYSISMVSSPVGLPNLPVSLLDDVDKTRQRARLPSGERDPIGSSSLGQRTLGASLGGTMSPFARPSS